MAIEDIYAAVMEFDLKGIADRVQAALDSGTDVKAILNEGLIAPLDEVGRRFSLGELFMPEMLRAANTMKKGLELLRPHLENADALTRGTVVMGTVKGDLHDIGKNLVGMMLEGGGFKVVDLGVDVGAERFIAAVEENGAQVVGLSALLTTTMPAMKSIIAAIREKGLAVKIMVGGAPVTQGFAEEIGADGYSDDAPSAVNLVRSLV
jgi:5-methyltetrahydrofolate--homocysteine methyltransferase